MIPAVIPPGSIRPTSPSEGAGRNARSDAASRLRSTSSHHPRVASQQVTYGGMPVVVDALDVYGEVLRERGEPFPGEEEAPR